MASSGSITTSNSNGYRNVTFQWSVKSQSIANNTTTISWSIVGAQNGSDGWYYAGPFNLTIDGKKVVDNLYPSGSRIQLRAGTVVKTGETTLTHATNGTKSFSATLTAAVYDLNDRSVSSSWSLDAIPRQSSASIASSYNIGSSHSISISRASSSYYHRISYKYGSESETLISSNATTSATLNLTSWGSKIPSAMSADVTIYLRTYPTATDASNNTNQIGSTATYSTSFVIPSYSQGTPSVTRAEANASNTTGVYVQNISKLKFTISATANYGATLSYKVVVAGQTMTSSSNIITTTSAIATSGTVGATITVTDSRGKSASTTLNTTVVAYSAPKITVAKAARSASNAAQITCTISCSVSSIKNGSTEKNSMKAYAIYDTDTSFPSPSSTYQFSTSGLSASNVSKTYTGLSTSSTYYIQLRVVDIFGYSSQVVKVGLGGILHITKNGIGVMKRRESGALDVEGAVHAFAYGDGSTATFRANSENPSFAAVSTKYENHYVELVYGASGKFGIYTHDGTNGKYLISKDQSGNVLVDDKTPVYTSTDQTINGDKNFTGKLKNIILLPTYTAGDVGVSTSDSDDDFLKALLKKICTAYPNREHTEFIGACSPNSRRLVFIYIYNTSNVSASTGLPEYSFGQWVSFGKSVQTFATSEYNYTSCRILSTLATVSVSQGGTGSTSAASARYNLGIGCTQLYSGTLTSGSTTFNYGNYSAYLIYGLPSGETSICSIIVPKAMLTTSNVKYEIGVGSAYTNFYLKYSGTTVTLTWNAGGSITKVYGMN